MRLLTHNSLKNPAKGVQKGYPLHLEVSAYEVIESDYNADFIKGVLPGLDWNGLCVGAQAVGFEGLPNVWEPSLLADDDFLQAMHRLLLDIHIKEGFLVCPESGKKFPIQGGIPNMMLPETEV